MTEITICRVYPTEVTDDIDREPQTSPIELIRLTLAQPPPGAICSTVDFLPDFLNFGPLRRFERAHGILLQSAPDGTQLQWLAEVKLTQDDSNDSRGQVWILDG